MRTALTIAGSDCSGGAGIQADIKTMTAHGVYAMSVVTALTAQNTTGVKGISDIKEDFLGLQLDCVFQDIFPDAVKTGMFSSAAAIRTVSGKLREYKARNIVVDPVMVSTSGTRLISDAATEILKAELFSLANVITPNIPEATVLSGIEILTDSDMVTAAALLYETYGCAVLVKGGHKIQDANDLLYIDGKAKWFQGIRLKNEHTHGTGCTLSSAIASNLAKGYPMEEAVNRAKIYISEALREVLDLGKGTHPLNHAFGIRGEYG